MIYIRIVQNKNNKNMNSYEKIEMVLNAGIDEKTLWEEIIRWLPEDTTNSFIDDVIRTYDIDI